MRQLLMHLHGRQQMEFRLFSSIYGGRFVQQDMYWGSWNNTLSFGTNSTYEMNSF